MKNTIIGIAIVLCCTLKMDAQTLNAAQPGVTISQITAFAQANLSTTDTGEGGNPDRFNLRLRRVSRRGLGDIREQEIWRIVLNSLRLEPWKADKVPNNS